MTQLRGAYARGRPTASLGPAGPEPVAEYEYTGPHWRVYVDTTVGQAVHTYRLKEMLARRAYADYEWRGWRGIPHIYGNVTYVAGLLVAPDGSEAARWGERPLEVGRPRWRQVHRLDHWTWRQCPGCGELLWPHRIVAAVVRDPTPGHANDEVCRPCLVAREIDDPRPSWGGEPYRPLEHQQPGWVRKQLERQARAAGLT